MSALRANQNINCFKDAYFSSIYTLEFARVIDISIQKDLSGVYNCGSADSCSKFEFAEKIAELFGFDKLLITPISIDDFNFKAKRGKNLILNVDKLEKHLGFKLTTINDSINSYYRDYICGLPESIGKNLK